MAELSAPAREHFTHPRNAGAFDPDALDVATARVGEPASGDILQLQLRVGEGGTIAAARFKAYGSAWTIACGSLLTERIQGRTLADVAQFQHDELLETLAVPPAKLHCAVLAETALKAALRVWAAPRTPVDAPTQIHQSRT
ncbi:MAG: iron-sulfur cluster assembly scaffold protein [Candidatus Competibacter sp.]|nr:iron-sulfur cluster assembly scaffold protein [Candidatus Competibacter sp.]MDG4583614.1 iron-sulfur cluster assembly scaffold protein [Candidatus Competibacter sp.]